MTQALCADIFITVMCPRGLVLVLEAPRGQRAVALALALMTKSLALSLNTKSLITSLLYNTNIGRLSVYTAAEKLRARTKINAKCSRNVVS